MKLCTGGWFAGNPYESGCCEISRSRRGWGSRMRSRVLPGHEVGDR
jgi:hypothetical protein